MSDDDDYGWLHREFVRLFGDRYSLELARELAGRHIASHFRFLREIHAVEQATMEAQDDPNTVLSPRTLSYSKRRKERAFSRPSGLRPEQVLEEIVAMLRSSEVPMSEHQLVYLGIGFGVSMPELREALALGLTQGKLWLTTRGLEQVYCLPEDAPELRGLCAFSED